MKINEWIKVRRDIEEEIWFSKDGKPITFFDEETLEILDNTEILTIEFTCKDDIIIAMVYFNIEEETLYA